MLQLNLTAEEELEIEYEVDGWFYVSLERQTLESLLGLELFLRKKITKPNWDQLTNWQVKKKRPGRDGKMAGLVPVLYVNQS